MSGAAGPVPVTGPGTRLPYRVSVPESNEASTHSVTTPSWSQPGANRPGASEPGPAPKPPLRPGRLLAAAARVGRRDPWRILAVAVVISMVTVLAEITAEHAAAPHDAWQEAVADILAEGIALLGTVLLSGFLCRLTSAADRDQRVTLGHVARTLPWGRLIVADIVVSLATIVGLLALLIPGLVLATLLVIVGPVIEIEDRPARVALRRSVHLVRPYFWRVALLATVPVIALSELEAVGPEPSGAPEILEVLAIRGIAEGLLEAAFGLVLIQLTYRLMAADALRAQAAREAAKAAP
jgi:hypothetical protein